MSSSSSRSSLPPRSPAIISPSNNPFETLLPHLVASKRSLSTVDLVYRANDLCTFTRSALETSAVTTARISFLCSGITSQLAVLEKVQQQTDKTVELAQAEFEDVVTGVGIAEGKLQHTLDGLRGTNVEAQLRPEGEEKRCLLDFVDEGGVKGLVEGVKVVVDDTRKELLHFVDGNKEFCEETRRVRILLRQVEDLRGSRSLDIQGKGRCPIPEILGEMEDHAKDMAVNLESLVSHFDLCVTAIKYTEGGDDAALKIADDLPTGVKIGHEAPNIPISDEQRLEMMQVLEEDAGHVEDVVMEIKSHIVDMDAMYQRVEAHVDLLSREHETTMTAFKMLDDIGHKLPSHIMRSQTFLSRWDERKVKIDERLEELDNAKGFYDGFLRAYDSLIIEIGRRKSHEAKTGKVVQDALSSLGKLYEDDWYERNIFKREHGEYLPVDIWPGLLSPPTQFNIEPVDGIIERIPDISKSVIHKAIRRVHGPV